MCLHTRVYAHIVYMHRALRLLIDAKADVHAANADGATPIDVAADNEAKEALELLVGVKAAGYEAHAKPTP